MQRDRGYQHFGNVKCVSTQNAGTLGEGALVSNGGLSVNKDLRVGQNIYVLNGTVHTQRLHVHEGLTCGKSKRNIYQQLESANQTINSLTQEVKQLKNLLQSLTSSNVQTQITQARQEIALLQNMVNLIYNSTLPQIIVQEASTNSRVTNIENAIQAGQSILLSDLEARVARLEQINQDLLNL